MARPRGTKWQADVQTPSGRQRRTFESQVEAQKHEAEAAKDQRTIGKLFPTYAREIWGGTKDERNCLRICDELVVRLGPSTLIHKITTKEIDKLTITLKNSGNKARTINTKLTRLSKLLKKARRLYLIEKVPDIDLEKTSEGRIRFLTPAEEKVIFNALPDPYRRFCEFLLYTGCRVGEALALTWADVNQTHATFWVTKAGRPRTVPLMTHSRDAIPWNRQHDLIRPFGDIRYQGFLKAWRRARKAAGLEADKQVVPHVLRHTCASRLVQSGVDIRRVKDWLGHSTLDMTLRYAHLAPRDLDLAAMALEKY